MQPPQGFKTAGIAAGIKNNDQRDLGLVYSIQLASVAGVFTRNRVQASPVLLDREHIRQGRCQALVVNSGNANCCNGSQGYIDAQTMARLAADQFNLPLAHVLVASTGVIGQPLPIGKIEGAFPALIADLSSDDATAFAEAILTTDTTTKMARRQGQLDGKPYSLMGIAKGAGMIRPDMATLLAFFLTDLAVPADILQPALSEATQYSFNRITIDGDTSTNDCAFLLANGCAGAELHEPEDRLQFQHLLNDLALELARLLVKDGEGVTKLVTLVVEGAASDTDAQRVARTVAESSLVKTALFGEDANWGRVLAAVGRSGAQLAPDQVDIYFDEVCIARDSTAQGLQAESAATAILELPEFTITVDLKQGEGRAQILTCDFSLDYVRINADYRS
jgi:glutamate N-acetyltransferase/amino-acid N-acetyltransferase